MLRDVQDYAYIFTHTLHDTHVKFYIHIRTRSPNTNIKKVKKI
jgi:hypothetical protein